MKLGLTSFYPRRSCFLCSAISPVAFPILAPLARGLHSASSLPRHGWCPGKAGHPPATGLRLTIISPQWHLRLRFRACSKPQKTIDSAIALGPDLSSLFDVLDISVALLLRLAADRPVRPGCHSFCTNRHIAARGWRNPPRHHRCALPSDRRDGPSPGGDAAAGVLFADRQDPGIRNRATADGSASRPSDRCPTHSGRSRARPRRITISGLSSNRLP